MQKGNTRERTRRWLLDNKVVQNTAAMTAGGLVRLFFQAVYFVVIARSLGAEQYGVFIGAVSLIAVATPFSIWGADGILIRNVARHKDSFAESWGSALSMAGVAGSLLTIAVLLIAHFVFAQRAPLLLVFLIGVSDLILGGMVTLASHSFSAFEMMGRTAEVGVVLTAGRALFALLLYVFVPHPTAVAWAVLYLGSTTLGAVYALAAVSRSLGYPRFKFRSSAADLREGFYFSLSLSSQSTYNNIDKTMLVRMATLEAAGIYSTAYRIVDLALQPVSSLLYSTYARFFQYGAQGLEGTSRYAKRLLPLAAAYGVLAGIALFAGAPILPLALGRSFHGADTVLRWLSPLILFRAIHYFLCNTLTGAGFQGVRSIFQLGIAIFNIGLNLWLIPLYSWRGAAWASLASDGLLAISVWVAIVVLRARSKPTAVELMPASIAAEVVDAG